MRLECHGSPDVGLPARYSPPSPDFSRPGRLWWALPGDGPFSTWRELSRVYHEGAPGHHLQQGGVVARAERLDAFRRQACDVAGYSEGWAVYAEGLMDEWGYLDNLGYRLGYLDGQLVRTARVILDIGLHLALEIPAGHGFPTGARWNHDHAVQFMATRTSTDPEQCRYEVIRYLGWPGQAASYKIGEQTWLSIRRDCQRRSGTGFDPRDFHRTALALGPMGLDLLRAQFAGHEGTR
jgi:uncharacterized protein (DUF885 family)